MNPSPLPQRVRRVAFAAIFVSAVLQGAAIARGADDPLARAADRLERQLAAAGAHERVDRDESFVPLSLDALRQITRRGPDALIEHACNALEQRLFADAADRRLDQHTLLDAALIASGVTNKDDLQRYQDQREALLRKFRSSPPTASPGTIPSPPMASRGTTPSPPTASPGTIPSPPMASVGTHSPAPSLPQPHDEHHRLAVALFDFMHEHVLDGGYRLECTDLRVVLDRGRYNCVSSSVLYKSLGDALGLRIVGLEMPGHALLRLQLDDGRAIDIETTCPQWFHLKDRPEQRRHRLREQLGEVAAGDRSTAREVSPVDLAAMIYYNRGVGLLAERRFAEAAIANAKALHLDPRNEIAQGNLLATLNNWAIAMGESGRFAEAVEVIEAGLAIDPDYKTFAQNYVHVHHQWTERLVAEGRFDEACQRLRRATAVMPDRPYLRQTLGEIERRRAAQQHGYRGT